MNRRHATLLALAIGLLLVLAVASNPGLLITGYDTTTVEAVDGETDEPLATADVRIADTQPKRYVGLSDTDDLGPDEGMLFVHDEPGEYGYVMRDMAFAIDIIFIDADGTVTAIYEAEPESRPLTVYEGQGQYVLEVPMGWSEANDVTEGDRIEFDLP
ncbi:DUF192 domain-containing protein [Halorubrum vacuolatum]|uniref:DUF192 domain-containing protein n=1 Tax=Halorubrum vacuolatum TaxID=63740 RepID=A0A238WSV7_HALVU|nr:DUF192 domain-containing protein [Halorubrum vacuolatum]SNR49627.1 hypothetical protein SAMN06264855_1104 [Halorubrum vacuolatum]